MTNRLEGTKAVITGGAGAIGLATARTFLRQGASVHIADLDGSATERCVAELNNYGKISGSSCDVSSPRNVEVLMRTAADAMGGISALINNAGTNKRGPLNAINEEDIDRMLAINVKGVMLCTQAAIPHLRRSENSSVTSTSSQAGKRGWAEISVYCATKAAVIGFSRAMAIELAPKIRVNTIAPGHIIGEGMAWEGWSERTTPGQTTEEFGFDFANNYIPLRRGQTTKDIADGFVYLTSSEAKEITGISLTIGGGVTMD